MSQTSDHLPLPRLFLRDLIVGCDLGYGSRLIDVGCGQGELTSFCHSLGIDAAGYDDDVEAVAAARIAFPELAFDAGTLANSIPYAAGEYDAAFVRGMAVYEDELDSIEAYASTANLLSCLRPLGKLVFLFDDALAPIGDSFNGRQQALSEHFGQFPGRCRAEVYAEGIGRFVSPSFLLGRRPRRGHSVLTMQIPSQPIDRLNWHNYAREAVMSATRRAA